MGNNNDQIQAVNAAFRTSAERMALRAGELLLKEFQGEREISYKGRTDLVTEMDRASEKLILSMIAEEFSGHEILAEESGARAGTSGYRWIVDPLDGTVNYAHGFPFFAVSIALEKAETGVIAGAVYAPYLREMYTAQLSCGAELNGEPIRVSSTVSLEQALLATGFPYDVRETGANIEFFTQFLHRAQAIRRPGSAALDLCAVAAGRFDGFWETGLNPWDTAAGALIVTEAGGCVTGFDGMPYSHYGKKILATNGHLHGVMREVLEVEQG